MQSLLGLLSSEIADERSLRDGVEGLETKLEMINKTMENCPLSRDMLEDEIESADKSIRVCCLKHRIFELLCTKCRL